MNAKRVTALVAILAVATWTATQAMTHGALSASGEFHEDSLRPGPDSGRVAKMLDALGKTDPLVCELLSDQVGNSWWSDGRDGLGRFTDATPRVLAAKDSIGSRVRDAGAIKVLTAALATEDACVRRYAAAMLGRSSIKTTELIGLLGSSSIRIREAAAYAIASDER